MRDEGLGKRYMLLLLLLLLLLLAALLAESSRPALRIHNNQSCMSLGVTVFTTDADHNVPLLPVTALPDCNRIPSAQLAYYGRSGLNDFS